MLLRTAAALVPPRDRRSTARRAEAGTDRGRGRQESRDDSRRPENGHLSGTQGAAARSGRVDGHGEALALLTGSDFTDGTIEVDLAGRPAAGADDAARGFVGIAFRSAPHAAVVRVLLPPADQRPRRRSTAPQPLDAVRLGAGISLAAAAHGDARRLRVLRRSRHRRLDAREDRSHRRPRAALRQRRRAAGAGRQRSQTRRQPAARSACGARLRTEAYFRNLRVTQ